MSRLSSRHDFICHLLPVCLSVAFLFVASPQSKADVTSEPLPGVTVENAVATPAGVGGTSTVRFRIFNSGVEDISLRGLRSEAAGSSGLVLRDSLGIHRDVEMLSIKREEELDLSTSHIFGELRGLRDELVEGGYVDIELVFGNGAIPVEAHVHGSVQN